MKEIASVKRCFFCNGIMTESPEEIKTYYCGCGHMENNCEVYGTVEFSSTVDIDPLVPLHKQIPEPMQWISGTIDELYDIARFFDKQGKPESSRFITEACGKMSMLAHGYSALLEQNNKLVCKVTNQT
jgi:hypothetical protein